MYEMADFKDHPEVPQIKVYTPRNKNLPIEVDSLGDMISRLPNAPTLDKSFVDKFMTGQNDEQREEIYRILGIDSETEREGSFHSPVFDPKASQNTKENGLWILHLQDDTFVGNEAMYVIVREKGNDFVVGMIHGEVGHLNISVYGNTMMPLPENTIMFMQENFPRQRDQAVARDEMSYAYALDTYINKKMNVYEEPQQEEGPADSDEDQYVDFEEDGTENQIPEIEIAPEEEPVDNRPARFNGKGEPHKVHNFKCADDDTVIDAMYKVYTHYKKLSETSSKSTISNILNFLND